TTNKVLVIIAALLLTTTNKVLVIIAALLLTTTNKVLVIIAAFFLTAIIVIRHRNITPFYSFAINI
ncbi:hypothetical protein P4646_18130, partial [Peribacillus simplex]|uniref:hypothetical protein n=1 Tax=Peribacillus simplex TaxID=1478 RepID=UPI002E2456E2|nr:hypothetical protein [Peribacillus simplex]